MQKNLFKNWYFDHTRNDQEISVSVQKFHEDR